jgi:hypothetical protein
MTSKTFDVGQVLSASDVNEYLRAGYWRRIARLTATSGSPMSNASFTSIPSTYKHLKITYNVRITTGASDYLRIRINNDTGINYTVQRHTAVNTESAAASFDNDHITLSIVGDDNWCTGTVTLSKPTTSDRGIGLGHSAAVSTVSLTPWLQTIGILWDNTSSLINRVDVYVPTGNFYGTVFLEGSA